MLAAGEDVAVVKQEMDIGPAGFQHSDFYHAMATPRKVDTPPAVCCPKDVTVALKKQPFIKCAFCSSVFITQDKLCRHLEKAHIRVNARCRLEPRVVLEKLSHVKCAVCESTFRSKVELQQHSESAHAVSISGDNRDSQLKSGPSKQLCTICNKSFETLSAFRLHTQKLHSENRFECDLCDFKCTFRGYMYKHMLKHLKGRQYQCDVCESKFYTKASLKAHKQIHEKEMNWKLILSGNTCNIAGLKFKKNINISRHINNLTEKKIFKCQICSKTFRNKYTHKAHLMTHAEEWKDEVKKDFVPVVEHPYNCNTCDKLFTDLDAMNVHILVHSKKGEYECKVCHECFSQRSCLKSHMQIHSSELPFKCDVCEKTFAYKCNLKSHMSCHMTKRPYQCDVCKQSFKNRIRIYNHMKTHFSPKVKCHICFVLIKKKSFKRHLLVHSKYKPQCDICGQSFSKIDTLKVHMFDEHNVKC